MTGLNQRRVVKKNVLFVLAESMGFPRQFSIQGCFDKGIPKTCVNVVFFFRFFDIIVLKMKVALQSKFFGQVCIPRSNLAGKPEQKPHDHGDDVWESKLHVAGNIWKSAPNLLTFADTNCHKV